MERVALVKLVFLVPELRIVLAAILEA